MYRNVEVQFSQIDNAVNPRIPSKTKVNPREHHMTITFRSGRQYDGSSNVGLKR